MNTYPKQAALLSGVSLRLLLHGSIVFLLLIRR